MESNLAENGARHPRKGLVTLPLNQIIEFARARKKVICPIFIIFILSAVYLIPPINAENLRFGPETVLTNMASIENVIKGTSHYPAQNGYVTSLDVYLDVDLSVGFGERRVGGTGGYGGPNAIAGQTYTATESGLAESICANLDVTLQPKRMKAALYNPTDRSLIASTLEKTVAVGTGWVTFDFSTPVPITAGNSYLVVYWCEFFSGCGSAAIREGHAPVSVTANVVGANYATLGGVFPSTLPAGGSYVGWYFNIYVKYKDPPTSRNVKGAIYVDLTDAPTNGASLNGPHTFLAETTPITVSGSGWHTLYFPNPPTVLAGHRYVISAWSDSGVGYVGMRYGPMDVGLLLEGHSLDAAYDGWPSSPTLVHERPDYYVGGYTKYSAYASYSTTPPNPVAVDDSYSVNEDQTLTVAAPGVLGNDNDPDGNPITAELVSSPLSGYLILNTDGGFTYTPGSNFHGSDSFTYKAKDASLYSNTATVTITVNSVNDAPIAKINGPYSGVEGSSITLDASASSDPDGDPLQYRWDFNNDGVWDTTSSSNPFACNTWNDDWSGNVVVEVTDGELTSQDVAIVTIANQAPVVEAGPDQTMNEGDVISFTGAFTDAGSADMHTVEWNFGDGGSTSGSLTPTHTYIDNGVYTVTLTVTDDDGGSASDFLTVTIVNVAPVVEAGSNIVADEGDNVSFQGAFNDPGTLDTHVIAWSFGDGGTASGSLSPTHVYVDDGVYIATLIVTDKDSGTTSNTITVTVNNLVPVVEAGSDQTVNENELVSLSGAFTDAGSGDTHVITWDFGDGETSTGSLYTTHIYLGGGVYTVTLTVTDDDGGQGSDTLMVTVNAGNTAPVLNPIIAPIDPVKVNTIITATATFTDPDVGDTHTAEWSWGDGTTSTGVVDEIEHSITGTHGYANPGIYTLDLTINDSEGAADLESFQYIVVYDPNGGFVTGGGWINSPAGAYTANPDLTGKANFGFVSKYHKGANVPTGETQFAFKVANLNFFSESYDWLVVAGSRAKFKGDGTVNGISGYSFIISAIDRQPDLFRIKIWDKTTELVIYDNQLGSSIDSDPTTILGGGSIVIHK